MSCVHPIPALDLGYRINDKGVRVRNIKLLDVKHKHIGFGLEELKERYGESLLLLPCGHCYSCVIEYSRTWASRIMLESTLHLQNCFITLTYSDSFVPSSLTKRPLQLFIKRLRKEFSDITIRYFACGELGEGKGERQEGNPHYHIIVFGLDFNDKVLLKRSGSGQFIFRSPTLERLWPYGISSIGTLTPDSAQYVAKYSLKRKTSGKDSGEFVLMSRRPGIGAGAYTPDVWDTGRLYLSGQTYKVPRYFEKLAAQGSLDESFRMEMNKFNRCKRGKTYVSKKYLYNLDREEDALKLLNEQRILKDCMKVRI